MSNERYSLSPERQAEISEYLGQLRAADPVTGMRDQQTEREEMAIQKVMEVQSSVDQQIKEAEGQPGLGQQIMDRSWAVGGAKVISRGVRAAFDPNVTYGELSRTETGMADQYDAEYQLTPEEKKTYIEQGVLPDRVVEEEDNKQRRYDAAIAAQGGTAKVIYEAIKADPGMVAKELAMGIAADPYLLLIPAAWGGVFARLTQAGMGAKKAAATATAAEAAAGAALVGAGEAVLSESQTGEVDENAVQTGAMIGGGAGFLMGAGQSMYRIVKRAGDIAARQTAIESEHIQAEIIRVAREEAMPLQEATQKVLGSYGVDARLSIDEMNTLSLKIQDLAEAAATEAGVPTPPKVRADKQAAAGRKAQLEMEANEMADRLKPQTTSLQAAMDKAMANGDGKTIQEVVAEAEGALAPEARKLRYEVDRVWASSAYRPTSPTLGKPIMTVEEFAQTPMGQSKSGNPLNAETLVKRWEEFHKDIMAANRDPDMVITKQELEEIMSEGSPMMRDFFMTQGKRKGARTSQIPEEYRPGADVGVPVKGQIKGEVPTSGLKAAVRHDASGDVYVDTHHYSAYNKLKKDHYGEEFTDGLFITPHGRILNRTQAQTWAEREMPGAKFESKRGGLDATEYKDVKKAYVPKGQRGQGDVKLLSLMGASGIAGLMAYSNNHDITDAVKWAILTPAGILGASAFLRKWARQSPVLKAVGEKKKLNLHSLYNKWQGEGAVKERQIMQMANAMYVATGGKRDKAARALREQITDALEKGDLSKLPAHAYQVAKTIQETFAKVGKQLKEEGLIEEVMENYAPHIWRHASMSNTKLMESLFGTAPKGVASKSMHEYSRVIPSYAIGEKVGLQPRTKDAVDLLALYLKSVDAARRHRELFSTLRSTVHPDGKKLILPVAKAPKSYVRIGHPLFSGKMAHPDIAPAARAIFGGQDFGAAVRGALGINFFLKRMAVSMSGFHAKALLVSAMSAGGIDKFIRHPIKSTRNLIQTFKGNSPHLKMFLDGDAGDEIAEGLRNGLMLNIVDDVGADQFYEFLSDMDGVVTSLANKIGEIGGLPGQAAGWGLQKVGNGVFTGLEKMNKWVDMIMWDRIYTGMKISTYMTQMEKMAVKYGNTMSRDEMSRLAAEFTNDAFGGLNWLRLAENVEGKAASRVAYDLVSRKGRAVSQLAMFAPDWTTSNLRVAYRALFNKSKASRDMYMGYQLRGMAMLFIGFNAMNYAFTGHTMFENDDPASVELGDGRRFIPSKQLMEPYKWATAPGQSLLGKMATIPKTGLELATGRQWIAGSGKSAPPIENNLRHIGVKFLPIWGHQWVQDGTQAGLWSMAGVPMYGSKNTSTYQRK